MASSSFSPPSTGLAPRPGGNPIPAFHGAGEWTLEESRGRITEAIRAWLAKSPSADTRSNYARDVQQFVIFAGISPDEPEQLTRVVPGQVAAWRDSLQERGLANSSINRKMTALRSLYSYLQTYGYAGANPAHADFVDAPPVPRDGKTVGLSPEDCRRLLDAPSVDVPAGRLHRALLGVLAYTGCRVGELCRLRIGDYKLSGVHRILEIRGKGGKERRVPLHAECVERLEAWLDVGGRELPPGTALFRPPKTTRGRGLDGFRERGFSRRGVQHLIARYVRRIGLDPAVTVHSLRVTALTTARERGSDIIDLQDFAGYPQLRITGIMRRRQLCGVRSSARGFKARATDRHHIPKD